MLTLNDGRAELWQWDTGRTLAVDADCSQVHFSNKVLGRSIDVDVIDGTAIIPDVLLQTDKDLNVWAFVGTAENGYTKISKTFNVNRRNKPADYVFTPTEQMTLQMIQRQIGDLADLTTEAKDTLVAAINEAARTGVGAGSMDLRVADGYIQYSRDGGMTWTNLIAMADLKGADGKSAYQYAVDAGYTGTEAEFSARMAAEIPSVDSTLTQSGQAADAEVVGNRLSALSEEKVTMPVDAGGTVQNGTSGQILQSNGDGTTQWVDKPTGVGSSSGITDINIKKWFGKKIVVDGSSITSGGSGNTRPTWHSFIKDMFALGTVYDHSLSGSSWLYSSSAYPSSYSRLQDYEADADAVIIMGDFSSSHVQGGTIDDAANVEGDTYYARLKGYAQALIAKYPLCPIIWAIEPPRNVGNPSEMSDSRKRAEGITAAIKAVAEYYGFPVADCFHKTIFRQYNETNYAETTSDGTHPWNNIQRTMAQIIAETMKQTPLLYNGSYVVTPDYSGGGGDSGGGTTDVTLTKITASENSGYTLFESDTLDTVKSCIRVVATYSDLSEKAVTDYTVTGELVAGTQTFTITYGTASTTIALTVTAGYRTTTITGTDYIDESLLGYYFDNGGEPVSTRDGMFVSTYIAVMPNTTITFSGVKLHGLSNADLVFYDASYGMISTFNITSMGSGKTTTVPENAAYFRFCDDTSSTNTITYVPG